MCVGSGEDTLLKYQSIESRKDGPLMILARAILEFQLKNQDNYSGKRAH
ncbi:hypothetical protein IJG71_00275 [Candidatus Saccharibacteria bacterium]|nr:hypothetical protein [Candidatus Saccharibacteria bacterium]